VAAASSIQSCTHTRRPGWPALSERSDSQGLSVIHGEQCTRRSTAGPHSVFFNDGTGGQFVEVKFGDKDGSAYGFALGDINGDKLPDIALARSGAPNVLYLNGR
jgi:hypothetical protein